MWYAVTSTVTSYDTTYATDTGTQGTNTEYYEPRRQETETMGVWTTVYLRDRDEFEKLVVLYTRHLLKFIVYIEKILKLEKWYIIYIFNCYMIRAPTKLVI